MNPNEPLRFSGAPWADEVAAAKKTGIHGFMMSYVMYTFYHTPYSFIYDMYIYIYIGVYIYNYIYGIYV